MESPKKQSKILEEAEKSKIDSSEKTSWRRWKNCRRGVSFRWKVIKRFFKKPEWCYTKKGYDSYKTGLWNSRGCGKVLPWSHFAHKWADKNALQNWIKTKECIRQICR